VKREKRLRSVHELASNRRRRRWRTSTIKLKTFFDLVTVVALEFSDSLRLGHGDAERCVG